MTPQLQFLNIKLKHSKAKNYAVYLIVTTLIRQCAYFHKANLKKFVNYPNMMLYVDLLSSMCNIEGFWNCILRICIFVFLTGSFLTQFLPSLQRTLKLMSLLHQFVRRYLSFTSNFLCPHIACLMRDSKCHIRTRSDEQFQFLFHCADLFCSGIL